MIASALLEGVPTDTRWVLLAAMICLFAGETYLFGLLGRQIKATCGPGYNAFQSLGSAAAVREARVDWGESGLAAARRAWSLDLVYPVTYALLGVLLASLGSSYAHAQGSSRLATAMEVVAWLAVAAEPRISWSRTLQSPSGSGHRRATRRHASPGSPGA